MDALLPQLLSFPPHPEPTKPISDSEYDRQIKNLISSINSIPASKLTSGVPGGGDLLDVRLSLPGLRSFHGALTDIMLVYRLLIPRKTHYPIFTHYSLTYMLPVESKSLAQRQIHFILDPHYGRRCWTSWKASTSVRSDTQAPNFGGS